MNAFQADSLRKTRNRLENNKAALFFRLSELTKQDPFSDPERLVDNAASDTEANEASVHDRVEAIISEINQQITDIDLALSAIGNGTYGICRICGRAIGPERLQVIPSATICISCENKNSARRY
jgi:RNA polymerase-binding transcription factor DksA